MRGGLDRLVFCLLVLIGIPNLVVAQEEDPYADYAYLWEDTKKKKKDKKKKKSQTIQDTTPAASTASPSVSQPDDTTQAPEITETENISPAVDEEKTTDTINTLATEPSSDTPDESVDDAALSDIVGSEKKTAAAGTDFRAGLPGSEPESRIKAGLGYTSIAGEHFVGLTLAPEFNFGKLGVGLHVPILYNINQQEVRTEIFEDGVGPARLLRYARYGTQKRDPYYFRLGELDQIMIGFGGLINNYTNTTSYEKRKLGLHFDVNYRGLGGLEGMYSDFDHASRNLLALRPYVRPLATSGIPVASTFEIGATYVSDKDQTSIPTSDSTSTRYSFTAPGISAFGIDAGLTVLQTPFIQIDLFANYAKLNFSSQPLRDAVTALGALPGASDATMDGFQNGSGFSAGVNFRLHFIADILSTDIRIERLNYKDHYLPQFFDTSYELNKDLRILTLASSEKQGGIYGSLTGHVIKKVRLGGSLMIPDDISAASPALMRLHADAERLLDKISLHASYTKSNLATLKDAFELDERSLAKVRFIYHLNDIITAGVDYYWSFAIDENGAYRATSFVSPYFGVSIDL